MHQFTAGLRERWKYVDIPYARGVTVLFSVYTTIQLLSFFSITGAVLPFSLSFLGAFLTLPILNFRRYSTIQWTSPILVAVSVAFSEFIVFKAAQVVAPDMVLIYTLFWSVCAIGPVMFFRVLWYILMGIFSQEVV